MARLFLFSNLFIRFLVIFTYVRQPGLHQKSFTFIGFVTNSQLPGQIGPGINTFIFFFKCVAAGTYT